MVVFVPTVFANAISSVANRTRRRYDHPREDLHRHRIDTASTALRNMGVLGYAVYMAVLSNS